MNFTKFCRDSNKLRSTPKRQFHCYQCSADLWTYDPQTAINWKLMYKFALWVNPAGAQKTSTLCPKKVVYLTHGDNFVNS